MTGRKIKPEDADFRRLVDKAFNTLVTITLGGRQMRMTNFEVILRRLVQRELAGDAEAFKARLAYEKFARQQARPEKQKVIVRGGLRRGEGDHEQL